MNECQYFRRYAGSDLSVWRKLIGRQVLHCVLGEGEVTAVVPNIGNQGPCISIHLAHPYLDSKDWNFPLGTFSDPNLFSAVCLPDDVPTTEELQWRHEEAWADYRRRLELAKAAKAEEERRQQEEHERQVAEEVRRQQEECERKLAIEAQQRRREALVARLQDTFVTNFLSADRIFSSEANSELVGLEEYQQMKTAFVLDWSRHHLDQALDAEQASAVAATTGDIQVTARAGSGKTRTLVARAIFLQQHCHISPRELLLLAFNRDAAREMRERLQNTLGEDLPHVMTFHALAHAIVHPDEELLYDDRLGERQSREIQAVIDDFIRMPAYHSQIRELMLAHFRDDWERIVDGQFHLSMDEFLAYHRALPRESLKGDFVKSFGEKTIANILFEYGLEYKYERPFHWNGVNYRPDFTVPTVAGKGGVIIEYFGLTGDADYDERSAEKRLFWAGQEEWTLIECTPADLLEMGVESFTQMLIRKLQAAGFITRRRSEEEIWQLISRRAIDQFTKAMKVFVGRCRLLNLSIDDLDAKIESHVPCLPVEAKFVRVGALIYAGYLQRLAAKNQEDFSGLMWRAVTAVRGGQRRFVRNHGQEQGDIALLRYVMIDEFQDFSRVFFELTDAIRVRNSNVQFFCVGDDWQAINGFAGSDTRYFTDFAKYFRNTSPQIIGTNYRSPKAVVALGNALMHGRGKGADATTQDLGWVRLGYLDSFEPSAAERERHSWDDITPAVMRLIRRYLEQDLDVVILARRHGVGWYVEYDRQVDQGQDELERFLQHVQAHMPEEDRRRVSASTAHGYKGLESPAVIVLDATSWSYPLIHPNWIFLRIFGDSVMSIEEEERRLFYVAISRARHSLVLLTDALEKSPFIDDIYAHGHRDILESLCWDELPPMPGLDGAHLEIRVSQAYCVRDQLRHAGFHWNATGKYWCRAIAAEGFAFDVWLRLPWVVTNNVHIDVYNEDGILLHSNHADNGR